MSSFTYYHLISYSYYHTISYYINETPSYLQQKVLSLLESNNLFLRIQVFLPLGPSTTSSYRKWLISHVFLQTPYRYQQVWTHKKLCFWGIILRIQKQKFTNYAAFEVKQSNALAMTHLCYWIKDKINFSFSKYLHCVLKAPGTLSVTKVFWFWKQTPCDSQSLREHGISPVSHVTVHQTSEQFCQIVIF